MRYFLTGATGFVGGELVRQLVDEGHEIVALVRDPARAADLPESVELAEGDLTDKESMREPMTGVDGVFHLAAWYRVGVPDDGTARRVNVDGTRNVLELVDELAIPKAVYVSTLAVNSDTDGRLVDESYRYDGPHLSTYDRTKWEAHHEVAEPMMADGLPLVVVMPGVIYGPGDESDMADLWRQYLAGDLPMIPRQTAFCWAHVADTAAAIRAAMADGEPGEEYVIAGDPYTLEEAMELAESITGVSAPRAVSPAWFGLAAKLVRPVQGVLPIPTQYRAESLRVLAGSTYVADGSKAREELGVTHRPFEDGLAELLADLGSE